MKVLLIASLLLATLFSCSPKLSPDKDWSKKRWVLIEVKGVPVQLSGTNRDAHIEFNTAEKRITGSGGCNRLNGSYKLGKKNAISFGDPATTKMLCADQAFEDLFLANLKLVDNQNEAGNLMLLKRGNEVVLKLQAK